MQIGRALIPINYTAAGPFDHDPAVAVPPIQLLQPAARLRTLEPESPDALMLAARLTRNRNRVTHAIDTATEVAERTLERIGERQ